MDDIPTLGPAEARILGSLIEKKELTPDVYPMTLNALVAAANQKTAREPVMQLDQAEIRRGLSLLEQKGLARQMFASRVERYEHLMAQRFALTSPQIAIVGLLLLRGPQTAHELLARSERLARFASIEDMHGQLDLLIGRRPPLVRLIERGPGQREERFGELLSADQPVLFTPVASPGAPVASATPIEARVKALEEEVATLKARLDALAGG
jgi:uncharacterized protein